MQQYVHDMLKEMYEVDLGHVKVAGAASAHREEVLPAAIRPVVAPPARASRGFR